MENDKTFELLTKMYADLKRGQDNLRKDIGALKSGVKKIGAKIY